MVDGCMMLGGGRLQRLSPDNCHDHTLVRGRGERGREGGREEEKERLILAQNTKHTAHTHVLLNIQKLTFGC